MKIEKVASYISIVLAIIYIIGFIGLLSLSSSVPTQNLSGQERLSFLFDHKLTLQLWYLLIYVLFGILLIPLSSILKTFYSRTILPTMIAIFGYIWASFVLASGFIFIIGIQKVSTLSLPLESQLSIWTTLEIIQDAFGGGIELLGGIWVFCIGANGFREGKFNSFFNGFSVILGVIGTLTILPIFYDLGAVFGMLQILWFISLGIILYKEQQLINSY